MELSWESQLCNTMNYAQNKKYNRTKTQLNDYKNYYFSAQNVKDQQSH